MEYVYAALLLHKLKQDVTEDNITNVIKATGANPDSVRIKALVAALSEVDIEEVLKASPMAVAASPTQAAPTPEAKAEVAEEQKKEEKKEEEALEGLSSLFG